MKVSIGYKLINGPWGGGNRFTHALVDYLQQQNIDVAFDLADPALDIILLTDPFENSLSASFSDRQIARYLLFTNPQAIVVHRVNECDERKGTSGVNKILRRGNRCADHTVFVSQWLQRLHQQHGLAPQRASIIRNGADRAVFNTVGHQLWNKKTPLKLVTHHWSSSWFKGFDIYQRLDTLIGTPAWRGRVEFTHIGNLPKGFQYRNSRHILPLHGSALATELKQHHVYLTASINEPGGNHQNEGACCGLPLLYRESGSMPEYCRGFGIGFTEQNFEYALHKMLTQYEPHAAKIVDYPYNASQMTSAYAQLFDSLLNQRDTLLASRQKKRLALFALAMSPTRSERRIVTTPLRRLGSRVKQQWLKYGRSPSIL